MNDFYVKWGISLTGTAMLVLGVGLAHGAGWALGVAGVLAFIHEDQYAKDFVE